MLVLFLGLSIRQAQPNAQAEGPNPSLETTEWVEILSSFPQKFDTDFLPVVNKTPLSPSSADFNQISSVWSKCRKWQAIHAGFVKSNCFGPSEG
jgi:hypothetical protein